MQPIGRKTLRTEAAQQQANAAADFRNIVYDSIYNTATYDAVPPTVGLPLFMDAEDHRAAENFALTDRWHWTPESALNTTTYDAIPPTVGLPLSVEPDRIVTPGLTDQWASVVDFTTIIPTFDPTPFAGEFVSMPDHAVTPDQTDFWMAAQDSIFNTATYDAIPPTVGLPLYMDAEDSRPAYNFQQADQWAAAVDFTATLPPPPFDASLVPYGVDAEDYRAAYNFRLTDGWEFHQRPPFQFEAQTDPIVALEATLNDDFLALLTTNSPHVFRMSDGVYVAIVDDDVNGVGYTIKTGSIWSVLTYLPDLFYTSVQSKAARNGDTIYVAVGDDQKLLIQLYKLVYSAGVITVTRVLVSDSPGGDPEVVSGIYWDPTNSFIHVMYSLDTAGATIKAFDANLVFQYSGTIVAALPAGTDNRDGWAHELVGDGGATMLAYISGSTSPWPQTTRKVVAGAASYTITSETPPAITNGELAEAAWDGTNFYLFRSFADGSLQYSKRTGDNTYDAWVTIAGATTGGAQAGIADGLTLFRKSGTDELLLIYSSSQNQANREIYAVFRQKAQWSSPQLLRGGDAIGYSFPSVAENDLNEVAGLAKYLYLQGRTPPLEVHEATFLLFDLATEGLPLFVDAELSRQSPSLADQWASVVDFTATLPVFDPATVPLTAPDIQTFFAQTDQWVWTPESALNTATYDATVPTEGLPLFMDAEESRAAYGFALADQWTSVVDFTATLPFDATVVPLGADTPQPVFAGIDGWFSASDSILNTATYDATVPVVGLPLSTEPDHIVSPDETDQWSSVVDFTATLPTFDPSPFAGEFVIEPWPVLTPDQTDRWAAAQESILNTATYDAVPPTVGLPLFTDAEDARQSAAQTDRWTSDVDFTATLPIDASFIPVNDNQIITSTPDLTQGWDSEVDFTATLPVVFDASLVPVDDNQIVTATPALSDSWSAVVDFTATIPVLTVDQIPVNDGQFVTNTPDLVDRWSANNESIYNPATYDQPVPITAMPLFYSDEPRSRYEQTDRWDFAFTFNPAIIAAALALAPKKRMEAQTMASLVRIETPATVGASSSALVRMEPQTIAGLTRIETPAAVGSPGSLLVARNVAPDRYIDIADAEHPHIFRMSDGNRLAVFESALGGSDYKLSGTSGTPWSAAATNFTTAGSSVWTRKGDTAFGLLFNSPNLTVARLAYAGGVVSASTTSATGGTSGQVELAAYYDSANDLVHFYYVQDNGGGTFVYRLEARDPVTLALVYATIVSGVNNSGGVNYPGASGNRIAGSGATFFIVSQDATGAAPLVQRVVAGAGSHTVTTESGVPALPGTSFEMTALWDGTNLVIISSGGGGPQTIQALVRTGVNTYGAWQQIATVSVNIASTSAAVRNTSGDLLVAYSGETPGFHIDLYVVTRNGGVWDASPTKIVSGNPATGDDPAFVSTVRSAIEEGEAPAVRMVWQFRFSDSGADVRQLFELVFGPASSVLVRMEPQTQAGLARIDD